MIIKITEQIRENIRMLRKRKESEEMNYLKRLEKKPCLYFTNRNRKNC